MGGELEGQFGQPTLRRYSAHRFGVFTWVVLLGSSLLNGTLLAGETLPSRTLTFPVADGRTIQFHRLPKAAALSQTRVSDIVQDDQGFIWFGTQDGLNRFDGYKCKVYRHNPQHAESLGGVYIHALFKDRAGFIWIASDQFLDRMDPSTETFTRFSLAKPNNERAAITVAHIGQDHSGLMWLSTNVGLFRLNPETRESLQFVHDSLDPSSIGDNDVKSTGEDRRGAFWVATAQTLDDFDLKTGKVLRHISTPHSGVGNQFHEDRFGEFWIFNGDDGTLGTLDRVTGKITYFYFSSRAHLARMRNHVFAMLEDRNGNMWFGSSDGIFLFDHDTRTFTRYSNRPGDSDSLASNRVNVLFEDREGTLWVGLHEAEPNFFSSKRPYFEKFTQIPGNRNSLDEPLVSALYEDRLGILWVGSDRGVALIDRTTGKYSRPRAIANSGATVVSVVEQGSNILWLGTDRGIKRYNRRTGQLKEYPYPPGVAYACTQSIIQRLRLEKDGTLWGATWEGLCHFYPATGRFARFKPDGNTWGLNYHDIIRDRDGSFWLGSEVGLHRFDPNTESFETYRHRPEEPHSLSDNRVNSVFLDHRGTLWVGTQNGLDKFDPGTKDFYEYGEQQGIGGTVVSCVLEDQKGLLWMSTNKGISGLNPETGDFRNYTVADGLPGNDLTCWGTCFKSNRGEMFFGGFSGAVAFFPDQIPEDTTVPPVEFTDFKLFGNSIPIANDSLLTRPISYTDTVSLSHRQNVFAIEFSALSYLNVETVRYRYRLDGFDTKWNEVDSSQRVAAYTALPHGTYTLRVEAATKHGRWSEPGARLQIHILPAWWQALWFRSLCVLFAILILWLAYLIRLRQATHRVYDRIYQRATERERIARDLHDTFFQSIQGLLLRFHTATSRLPEGHPARPMFEEALKQSDVVMAEGRGLLVDLHGISTKPHDLSTTLADAGQQMQEGSSSTFKVALNGDSRPLHPVVFEEVLRIGKEALSNAFRHSIARSVELELNFEPNEFRMRIRDDGVGIEQQILKEGQRDGHLGLASMRERAKNIGAHLDLWSRAGVGTEVEVRISSMLAYATGHRSKRRGFWQRIMAIADREPS